MSLTYTRVPVAAIADRLARPCGLSASADRPPAGPPPAPLASSIPVEQVGQFAMLRGPRAATRARLRVASSRQPRPSRRRRLLAAAPLSSPSVPGAVPRPPHSCQRPSGFAVARAFLSPRWCAPPASPSRPPASAPAAPSGPPSPPEGRSSGRLALSSTPASTYAALTTSTSVASSAAGSVEAELYTSPVVLLAASGCGLLALANIAQASAHFVARATV